MTKNRIDKKYYPFIWIGLIVASIVGNIYPIYHNFASLESLTRGMVTLEVIRTLFSEGLIPAAVVFFLAFIVYAVSARRTPCAIPRNDFIYFIMLFTMVSRLICGLIEAFCIIAPNMYVITSAVLWVVQLAAYALMFFLVFDKHYKMNPVEKYNSYRIWASIYLVVLGVAVVFENAIYLLVFENAELVELLNDALQDIGIVLERSSLQIAASAIALSLYLVSVVVAVVLGERMKKEMNMYRDPETREQYFATHPNAPYDMRDDVDSTYTDFGFDAGQNRNSDDNPDDKHDDNNSSSGNVFDEFDI